MKIKDDELSNEKEETEKNVGMEEKTASKEKNSKTNVKLPPIKAKKKFSLEDYIKKADVKQIEYKPDTWIPMSPAFMETTLLPGMPEGRIIMVYGFPNTGKSTVAMELVKYTQLAGKLPVYINTEKKFSWTHAETMGLDKKNMMYVDSLETVEEICTFIKATLKDQTTGELQSDVVFIWDSVGNVLSNAELKADENEESSAMMATAKILNQQIHRIIEKRISDTRKVNYPYNATLFIVNHAYQGTQQNTLTPYGGYGIMKAATIVIRMGGILSSATKCYAIKDGIETAYAIKTAIVVEKNHITNVSVKSKIICTEHGFVMNTNEALNQYKKDHKDNWELKYDKSWQEYDGD